LVLPPSIDIQPTIDRSERNSISSSSEAESIPPTPPNVVDPSEEMDSIFAAITTELVLLLGARSKAKGLQTPMLVTWIIHKVFRRCLRQL